MGPEEGVQLGMRQRPMMINVWKIVLYCQSKNPSPDIGGRGRGKVALQTSGGVWRGRQGHTVDPHNNASSGQVALSECGILPLAIP